MSAVEIVVIVLSVLFVSGVAIGCIVGKKKGKSSCCGECAHCKYNAQCTSGNKVAPKSMSERETKCK